MANKISLYGTTSPLDFVNEEVKNKKMHWLTHSIDTEASNDNLLLDIVACNGQLLTRKKIRSLRIYIV